MNCCNFSISSSIDYFVGLVSIPDTFAQRLSGLESRPYVLKSYELLREGDEGFPNPSGLS